jgi:propanediol dehydratase large subunit
MSKKTHIELLERKIKELQVVFESFGDAKRDLDEIWQIIHNPGWTTLPESIFVEAIVNAEHKHAQTTLELNKAFLEGARKVQLNPQPLPP